MDSNKRRGRSGRPWERIKAQIKAEATHCAKCGKPLTEFPWPNRWSTSIDHIVPLHLGGDPLDPNNLAAAHLTCNVREGSAISKAKRDGRHSTTKNYRNPDY